MSRSDVPHVVIKRTHTHTRMHAHTPFIATIARILHTTGGVQSDSVGFVLGFASRLDAATLLWGVVGSGSLP